MLPLPPHTGHAAHSVVGETAPAWGEIDERHVCKRCITADNDRTCQPCRIDEDYAADTQASDEDGEDEDEIVIYLKCCLKFERFL